MVLGPKHGGRTRGFGCDIGYKKEVEGYVRKKRTSEQRKDNEEIHNEVRQQMKEEIKSSDFWLEMRTELKVELRNEILAEHNLSPREDDVSSLVELKSSLNLTTNMVRNESQGQQNESFSEINDPHKARKLHLIPDLRFSNYCLARAPRDKVGIKLLHAELIDVSNKLAQAASELSQSSNESKFGVDPLIMVLGPKHGGRTRGFGCDIGYKKEVEGYDLHGDTREPRVDSQTFVSDTNHEENDSNDDNHRDNLDEMLHDIESNVDEKNIKNYSNCLLMQKNHCTTDVPSDYSANIKNLVLMKDLKSHDCHVLLTQMIPIAIRKVMPPPVRQTVTKLCLFFNMIHSKVIDHEKLDELQRDIILILCQLEMYFPPYFFDVMVHLMSYIVEEIKLDGPVFLWYMYPFERYMGFLKGYVRNRYRPKGSIVQGYVAEEVVQFCTNYIDDVADIGLSQPRHLDSSTMTITKNSYYGVVEDIWELDYTSFVIPLLKCKWVNNTRGVKVDSDGFTCVNLSTNGYLSDPFILAKQATQWQEERNDPDKATKLHLIPNIHGNNLCLARAPHDKNGIKTLLPELIDVSKNLVQATRELAQGSNKSKAGVDPLILVLGPEHEGRTRGVGCDIREDDVMNSVHMKSSLNSATIMVRTEMQAQHNESFSPRQEGNHSSVQMRFNLSSTKSTIREEQQGEQNESISTRQVDVSSSVQRRSNLSSTTSIIREEHQGMSKTPISGVPTKRVMPQHENAPSTKKGKGNKTHQRTQQAGQTLEETTKHQKTMQKIDEVKERKLPKETIAAKSNSSRIRFSMYYQVVLGCSVPWSNERPLENKELNAIIGDWFTLWRD
nr:hypothetical protein [Tanacetum cinerariifolium]